MPAKGRNMAQYRLMRKSLHHFPGRDEGPNGHAAADNLAVCCEIGCDAVKRLCSTVSHAKTGHDFVED